jgi:hypothetical protein
VATENYQMNIFGDSRKRGRGFEDELRLLQDRCHFYKILNIRR